MDQLYKVPKHVAIIMDGNGRWAKKKHIPTIAGHRAGSEVARNIVQYAAEKNIEYITLYTFSTENWHRETKWIDDFMGLLRWYFKSHLDDLHKNQVRVRFIGNLEPFPKDIQKLIHDVVEKTANFNRITVNLALGYSGRDDLCRAMRSIGEKIKAGALQPHEVDEVCITKHLDTSYMPDPDLLIRTSGEMRISNFLLWNIAYTECVFTDKFWPDFTTDDFEQALQSFQNRQRRYGR